MHRAGGIIISSYLCSLSNISWERCRVRGRWWRTCIAVARRCTARLTQLVVEPVRQKFQQWNRVVETSSDVRKAWHKAYGYIELKCFFFLFFYLICDIGFRRPEIISTCTPFMTFSH